MTNYATLKEIGRSTAAHSTVGARRWETLEEAHAVVQAAQTELLDRFCSLADPEDVDQTKQALLMGKQKMGFLKQTKDAGKQVVHTDGGYYSALVSRHDSTNLLCYVRDAGGILVEITIMIPKGFVLFFHGSVMHSGAAYPEGVPEGSERVFGYMLNWGKSYSVHSATLTKDEMCAQQGLDPNLYEKMDSDSVKRIKVQR